MKSLCYISSFLLALPGIAYAQNMYDACIEKLAIDEKNPWCSGYVFGYSQGASTLLPSSTKSTSSEVFFLGSSTSGHTVGDFVTGGIDFSNPMVISIPGTAGGAYVVDLNASSISAEAEGNDALTFVAKDLSTIPIEEWLLNNSDNVDTAVLRENLSAIEQISNKGQVIFSMPMEQ